MNELIAVLNSIKQRDVEQSEELIDQAISLASRLYVQNQELSEEVGRLSQIIRDVRERDARKTCLCRGQK